MSHRAILWALEQPVFGIAQHVLIRLADHHNKRDGQCNPSFEALARETGWHRTSIYYAVRTLEAAGLLIIDRRCGRTPNYCLAITGDPFTTRTGSARGTRSPHERGGSPGERGGSRGEPKPIKEPVHPHSPPQGGRVRVDKFRNQNQGKGKRLRRRREPRGALAALEILREDRRPPRNGFAAMALRDRAEAEADDAGPVVTLDPSQWNRGGR